uniref:Uncharacterized protein n=1 Tax=Arundo donax TaxID=35708 RepID=A0A0A8ZTN9_ARUDO
MQNLHNGKCRLYTDEKLSLTPRVYENYKRYDASRTANIVEVNKTIR